MKKILIVDDEQEILELVKTRLEANEFSVLTALDGESGISVAKEEVPDLILMDIMMPNMSGGDAVKILKADEKTRDIPVIFLTAVFGKSDEDEDGKGVNVAGQTYKTIAKPFDSEKMIRTINDNIND